MFKKWLKPKTRFNELRKEIPDISARMLSATLNASELTLKFMESDEPVTLSKMQVYMD